MGPAVLIGSSGAPRRDFTILFSAGIFGPFTLVALISTDGGSSQLPNSHPPSCIATPCLRSWSSRLGGGTRKGWYGFPCRSTCGGGHGKSAKLKLFVLPSPSCVDISIGSKDAMKLSMMWVRFPSSVSDIDIMRA